MLIISCGLREQLYCSYISTNCIFHCERVFFLPSGVINRPDINLLFLVLLYAQSGNTGVVPSGHGSAFLPHSSSQAQETRRGMESYA